MKRGPLDMEIRIAGYVAASWLLEQEPDRWHAVVILDSDKRPTEFVPAHTLSHLFLRFDDIEEPRPKKVPPARAQVEQALAFARGKERLLVSCRAGRGRSVALAYLIAFATLGADAAVELLDPTRHRPNRLVVSLGDGLPATPDALARFEQWRAATAHVRLSDFYEAMEQEVDALEGRGATNRISEP